MSKNYLIQKNNINICHSSHKKGFIVYWVSLGCKYYILVNITYFGTVIFLNTIYVMLALFADLP